MTKHTPGPGYSISDNERNYSKECRGCEDHDMFAHDNDCPHSIHADFYNIAIKERDYERVRANRIEAERDALLEAAEALPLKTRTNAGLVCNECGCVDSHSDDLNGEECAVSNLEAAIAKARGEA